MSFYYSSDEAEWLKSEIVNLDLTCPCDMLVADAREIQEACNGVGAEWLSTTSRKIITKMLHYAELSAAIHDWQYHNSNGDEAKRKRVDGLFLYNGLAEVRAKYPQWWNWRRWLGERAVLAAHEVLRRVGDKAWNDALAKRFLRVCDERGMTPDDFFNPIEESETDEINS